MKTLIQALKKLTQDWKEQYIQSSKDLAELEMRMKQMELATIRSAKIRMATIRL